MRTRKSKFIVISVALLAFVLFVGAMGCGNIIEKVKYDIYFDINGSTFDTVETGGNETITLPLAPIENGYTFEGWYFDKGTWQDELTADYYADKPLNNDVTVYAYYKAIPATKYTITFVADGSTVGTVSTAGFETITLPSAPNKSGYTFEGWYFDSGIWQDKLTENTYANSTPNGNLSVYAYYKEIPEPEKYTVTFETNGGESMAPVTVSVIETEPAPTRANYTFKGWYYDSSLTNKVSFPLTVTRAMTLYAKWEGKTSDITYIVSNGIIQGIASAPAGMLELDIPSEIDGETITGLKFGVFKGNNNIVKVTIPSTIKTIAGESFRDCTSLVEVNLPDTVTSINSSSFKGCSALTSIDLPESLTSIGSNAFKESGLTSVVFPNNLKSISEYAFGNCKALIEADMGSVESLGRGVFNNCTSLTSVTIPETVTYLEHHVFTGCTALADIDILADDAYLYYSLIDDTAYYENADNWKNGVLYIGKYIIVANTDDEGITSVDIEEDTSVIAAFAFRYNCSSLSSVSIPESVIRIGDDAFNETALYNNSSNWWNNGLYVDNCLLAVKATSMTSFTVKEGTRLIADGKLFDSYSSSVTQVSLPSSLETIGRENFGYTGITEITLPQNLKRIYDEAF